MAGALVDLGELSKPATVLIERVSDAVGGICKPWQIKRVAKAEAEAEIVRANSRIEISDLEGRAVSRWLHEEAQKQDNIERITAGSIEHLKEDSKPEDIDKDWLTHFFDRSRLVSDNELQSLWSKVLAGQANCPGSFSKKSVDLVSTLEKSDAELFTKFCSYVWNVGGLDPVLFEDDLDDELFKSQGIGFSSLVHLDDIGLITFNTLGGFTRTGFGKYYTIHYYGIPINIEFNKDDGNALPIGTSLLTRSGRELAIICGSSPKKSYLDHVIEKFVKAGYMVSSNIDSKGRWVALD